METRIQRIERMFGCSPAAARQFVGLLDSGVSWAKATLQAGVSGRVIQ